MYLIQIQLKCDFFKVIAFSRIHLCFTVRQPALTGCDLDLESPNPGIAQKKSGFTVVTILL